MIGLCSAVASLLLASSAVSSYGEIETYADHLKHMQYAKVLGMKMAYIDEGSGKPIVLMHGIPTSSWMYRKVIPGLVDAGYRVIAPDLMGLGASERSADASALTVKKQSEYVLELLAGKLRLGSWAHVVHDFGGPITWEMMEDPRFQIDRLVILDTFSFERGWSPGLNWITKQAMWAETSELFGPSFYRMAIRGMVGDKALATPNMVEGYCRPLDDGGGFTYKSLYFQANMLKKELPRYQDNLAKYKDLDVRIVWGGKDPFLSATEQMPQFRELLGIDEDKVLVLESAKHLIADEYPDRVVAFIR